MTGQQVAKIIYAALAIISAFLIGQRILSGAAITEMVILIIVFLFSTFRLFTMDE